MENNKPSSTASVSRFWSKINLMVEIASLFRNNRPEEATYRRALEMIQEMVSFESAFLYLYETDRGRLAEEYVYGAKPVSLELDRFLTGRDFAGWLAHQKGPVFLSDVDPEINSGTLPDGNLLTIPLLIEESLIGSVCFFDPGCNSFREKDIKLLTIIADQIAISIERSIYQSQLEKKNAALEKAQQELKAAQKRIIDNEKLTAVRELAVSINHEINNPLSVITGNAEYILCMHADLDEKLAERLRIIEAEALKISEINRRLLDIQDLVTERYLRDDDKIRMIDLKKSSTRLENV